MFEIQSRLNGSDARVGLAASPSRLRWFDVEWIAPERRSFVRAYPEIVELREEEWKYGLRP